MMPLSQYVIIFIFSVLSFSALTLIGCPNSILPVKQSLWDSRGTCLACGKHGNRGWLTKEKLRNSAYMG